MGPGASPRFAIVSIVVFTLSVCLGLPFEDVLDVAYDEKETQPFESTGLFSSAMLQVLDRALRSGTNFDCPLQSGCLNKGRERSAEQNKVHAIHDSLTILDHQLRC